MNIESVPPFNSYIMMGLEERYSTKIIEKKEVIKEIQAFQVQLYKKGNALLSANIIECQIILKGQIEPHLKIEFINYPKSNILITDLKSHIKELAEHLMKQFKQNRIVISFPEETIMIEESIDLDPRVY